MNRLSPYHISDPIVRASFYRDLRRANPDWDEYQASLDEIAMPEKIAWRYHGTPNAKLIVSVCAEQDDLRETIKPAQTFRLPSSIEARERIRYYQQLEERLKRLNSHD